MTGSPHRIRLILDASAIAAYGATVTVGEILGEVQDDGGAFAVPTACLAEAVARGADSVYVRMLQTHDGYTEFDSTTDWETLGRFLDLTRPSRDAVHDVADSDTAMLALQTGAAILTDRPDRYTTIFAGVGTILIEEP